MQIEFMVVKLTLFVSHVTFLLGTVTLKRFAAEFPNETQTVLEDKIFDLLI
jgi:hypothetical protein